MSPIIATTLAATVSPVVPRGFDAPLTALVSRVHLAVLPRRVAKVADQMRAHLPDEPDAVLLEYGRDYWRQRVETRWGLARGVGLRGWFPDVELIGGEHLATALQEGRGAILWRVSSHSATPVDRALFDAGFALTHLSEQGHLVLALGPWYERWIFPWATPLLSRAEARFLHRRLVMDRKRPSGPLREARRVVSEGGVLTLVGDADTGGNCRPVDLNGNSHQFALGGANLAVRSGAPLLPVLMRRIGPMRFEVEVRPPLDVDRTQSRRDAVAALVDQFAAVVADHIRDDPSQWPRWRIAIS